MASSGLARTGKWLGGAIVTLALALGGGQYAAGNDLGSAEVLVVIASVVFLIAGLGLLVIGVIVGGRAAGAWLEGRRETPLEEAGASSLFDLLGAQVVRPTWKHGIRILVDEDTGEVVHEESGFMDPPYWVRVLVANRSRDASIPNAYARVILRRPTGEVVWESTQGGWWADNGINHGDVSAMNRRDLPATEETHRLIVATFEDGTHYGMDSAFNAVIFPAQRDRWELPIEEWLEAEVVVSGEGTESRSGKVWMFCADSIERPFELSGEAPNT